MQPGSGVVVIVILNQINHNARVHLGHLIAVHLNIFFGGQVRVETTQRQQHARNRISFL